MSATKNIRNVFLKMNTDVSQIKQDNTSFYDAVDFRLISDEALSNGALVNFKGTKARLLISSQGNQYGTREIKLKGYACLGNILILLLYDVASDYSYIARALDVSEDFPKNSYGQDDIPSVFQIYSDKNSVTKLNFGSVDYISTVTRYESVTSQKLYFAVKGEPLRYINIVNPPSGDASILDIIPNNVGGNITIDSIVEGGNLQAGKIQYCYRAFKKYGAETTFSTTSKLVSLTASAPKGNVEFNGSDLETFVNKSVKINITGIDTTFDYINIYSIFYSQKGLPVVNLISELPIIATSLSFVDSGKVLDTITLEEFNSFGGRLFSANDIETKNNILFAAGIQEDTTDIDIDCRAYRFDSPITTPNFANIIIKINSNIFDIAFHNSQIKLLIPDSINTTYLTAKVRENPGDISFTYDPFAGEFPVYIDALGSGDIKVVAEGIISAVLSAYGPGGIASTHSITSTEYDTVLGVGEYAIIITYTSSTSANFGISGEGPIVGWNSPLAWYSYKTSSYSSSVTKSKARVYEKNDAYYEIEDNGSFNSVGIAGVIFGSDWLLPKTADCINKYNDEFLHVADDYSIAHPYPYDKTSSGAYYGGTGSIVSYKIELDSTSYELVQVGHLTTVNDYNKTFILNASSHKQGEVYRYGLNFYDLKGRPYFTKWIGDIRIPYLNQFTFQSSFPVGTPSIDRRISASNIKITFTVDLSGINSSILDILSGFRLARVERTQSDKSIITQGASWITGYDTHVSASNNLFMHKSFPLSVSVGDGKYTFKSDVESTADVCDDLRKNYIHPLYSPELFYNGGIDLPSGDYRIKIAKIFGDFDRASRNSVGIKYFKSDGDTVFLGIPSLGFEVATSIIYPISNTDEVTPAVAYGNPLSNTVKPNQSFSVLNSFKLSRTDSGDIRTVSLSDATLDNKEVNFTNRVLPYNNNYNTQPDKDFITMFGPTCGLFISNKPIFKVYNGRIAYVLDIYRNNASARYGGNTYYDRLLNTYIPTGSFIKVAATTSYLSVITEGDIYNTIFDTFTSLHDPKLVDGSDLIHNPGGGGSSYVARQQVVSLLPLESSVNCFLSNVKPSKYVLSTLYSSGEDQDSDKIGLQETVLQGVDLYGSKYPTDFKDLNSYNTAYSSVPIYPTTEPKPQIFEESVNKGTTVIASEKKNEGEIVDSWTKFLYSNVIEVESEYGDIHRLEAFKNKLYYFQESGIGILAVNDRYVISNGDAGQLALGTGGILERFDYIKYNEGIVDPRHLINAISSIYYIDHNKKVIDNIDTGEQSLSLALGVNSLFRSLYEDADTHVAFGYNPKYREVMITVGDKTLVLNENTKTFAPRHSTVPKMYLNNDYKLFSYIEDEDASTTARYIYQHGTGERGEVYSEAYLNALSTAKVVVIVNPNAGQVSAFDLIRFNTEVYADGDNIDTASDLVEDTINRIVCKNTYQSVSKTLAVDTDAIRQSGEFDFSVNTSRRARYWTTQLPLTVDSNRLVDNTLILTLEYDNNNNKLFKLQDLITQYRISN